MPMASGGYVTSPTNALVGEGGENEYVIPESRMSGAMESAGGARGESVINGANALGGRVVASPLQTVRQQSTSTAVCNSV